MTVMLIQTENPNRLDVTFSDQLDARPAIEGYVEKVDGRWTGFTLDGVEIAKGGTNPVPVAEQVLPDYARRMVTSLERAIGKLETEFADFVQRRPDSPLVPIKRRAIVGLQTRCDEYMAKL